MDDHIERRIRESVRDSLFIEVDELLIIIATYLNPEDVFSDDLLEIWAQDNGYVKDELK